MLLSVVDISVYVCKVEESWVSPAQSLSDNEQLMEDEQQKEEQITQEVDQKQDEEVQYRCSSIDLCRLKYYKCGCSAVTFICSM